MEEVSRIDKTNLTQLSFLILLYLLVTWGSQQQNKVKNNLKHEREKWTTGEEGIEGRTTRYTKIKRTLAEAEAEDAKLRNPEEEENSRRRGEWVAFFTIPVTSNIVSDEVQNPCFFFFKSQNMVPAEINWPEQPDINNIGAKACPKRTPSSRSRSLFLFRIRKSVLTELLNRPLSHM